MGEGVRRATVSRHGFRIITMEGIDACQSLPMKFLDRINRINRIPDETWVIPILLILLILSKILNVILRRESGCARKLGRSKRSGAVMGRL